MLRGWDLPYQANILVSFNTKLIPFNLVTLPCPAELSYSTYISNPETDLRFQSSPARTLPHARLLSPTFHRPPRLDKSKISFFLGKN
jgi:hypothetical protein